MGCGGESGFGRVLDDDQHDQGRLAARVEATVPTLSAFEQAREIVAAALAGETTINVEDLGYAAFLVNRCSRSGMVLGNVGPIGGKTQAGAHTVASRFNGDRLAERIRAVAAFGDRFRVYQGDGISYVESLADSGIEDEVFVFADPPYIGVGNRLYAHGMGRDQHQRLAAAPRSCPSAWVLTYDAHPDVLDLYPDSTVVEFEIPHTANRQQVGTEYLLYPTHLVTPGSHPLGKGHWQAVA